MKRLFARLLNVARSFTIVDFAIFKICLLSIGVLLGTICADFFREYFFAVWTFALFSMVYMCVQIYRFHQNK